MTDLNGKKTSLTKFKDKVVLVDYWWTGCMPCMKLAETIEQDVLPQIKEKKNLVFVSINGDKTTEEWRKSIARGVYTPKDAFHLFTDGLGTEHPFIKYYEFYGAPSILIIGKSGKLFSYKPYHDKNTLIRLLNEALSE